MKVREILRLIEDDGWYLAVTVGSHRQYKHPMKPGRVRVPGKLGRDLPIGTERSILQAGRAGPEAAVITYAIIIERADGGYGAWCPGLPGCVALGDTQAETIAEMREAIELHLAGMREDGIVGRFMARRPFVVRR